MGMFMYLIAPAVKMRVCAYQCSASGNDIARMTDPDGVGQFLAYCSHAKLEIKQVHESFFEDYIEEPYTDFATDPSPENWMEEAGWSWSGLHEILNARGREPEVITALLTELEQYRIECNSEAARYKELAEQFEKMGRYAVGMYANLHQAILKDTSIPFTFIFGRDVKVVKIISRDPIKVDFIEYPAEGYFGPPIANASAAV